MAHPDPPAHHPALPSIILLLRASKHSGFPLLPHAVLEVTSCCRLSPSFRSLKPQIYHLLWAISPVPGAISQILFGYQRRGPM